MVFVAAGLLVIMSGGVAAMLYQAALEALEWWDR